MCVSSLARSESSVAVWPPEFGTEAARSNASVPAAPPRARTRAGHPLSPAGYLALAAHTRRTETAEGFS